ncbi:MAG: hypothetical protein Q8833_02355, partial [Candidatus Phytoplasma australasiaticum]|nr:hypothetical protein [Candidatus Phytoplasma australasiaticum]
KNYNEKTQIQDQLNYETNSNTEIKDSQMLNTEVDKTKDNDKSKELLLESSDKENNDSPKKENYDSSDSETYDSSDSDSETYDSLDNEVYDSSSEINFILN